VNGFSAPRADGGTAPVTPGIPQGTPTKDSHIYVAVFCIKTAALDVIFSLTFSKKIYHRRSLFHMPQAYFTDLQSKAISPYCILRPANIYSIIVSASGGGEIPHRR